MAPIFETDEATNSLSNPLKASLYLTNSKPMLPFISMLSNFNSLCYRIMESIDITLRKIPKCHLISWSGNFVKRHSFRRLITNFGFWLVNILLHNFDTSSKKETKMIKTQIFDEKQKKCQESICKHKNAFFTLNSLQWPVM